jgi:hypothetical protein
MKEHLTRLLLEQYRQDCLFKALEEKGVNLNELSVNNLDIVFDIIGFPQDNSLGYDFDHLNSNGRLRDESKKLMDENFFCRDWLTDTYYNLVVNSNTEQVVFGHGKGIQIRTKADEISAEEEIANYVEWLHNEFESVTSGKVSE